MSNQTTMNGTYNGRSAPRSESNNSVVGNVADVLHDATELAELQVKLLATDIDTTVRKSSVSLLVLAVAGSFLLGLIPILLLALAEVLVHGFEWSRPAALFAASGCGLLVAAATGTVGAVGFKRSLTELDNSKAELERNLKWIKRTLKNGGSPSR